MHTAGASAGAACFLLYSSTALLFLVSGGFDLRGKAAAAVGWSARRSRLLLFGRRREVNLALLLLLAGFKASGRLKHGSYSQLPIPRARVPTLSMLEHQLILPIQMLLQTTLPRMPITGAPIG